jgi:hypothetical protein
MNTATPETPEDDRSTPFHIASDMENNILEAGKLASAIWMIGTALHEDGNEDACDAIHGVGAALKAELEQISEKQNRLFHMLHATRYGQKAQRQD